MLKIVAFYALSLLALAPASAMAEDICDTYSVARGDTLRLIAERYYGARDLSPILYEANTVTVGENPNIIEIGMEIAVPCRDGIQMPLASAFLATTQTATLPQEQRFLTKEGNTPFMSANGTGIIPDLLGAALRQGGFRQELNLERTGSSEAILNMTRADNNALLSFPWIMPDCANAGNLSNLSTDLCSNYTFSDPIYEITLGMFTLASSNLAGSNNIEDFIEKNLCIPQFHSDDLLLRTGILDMGVRQFQAPDLMACFDGLISGEFDAVVADYQSFATYYTDDPAEIVDIPAFARPSTLHAIAFTQNPEAMVVLRSTNAGLQRILVSGEWFKIVNDNLSARFN